MLLSVSSFVLSIGMCVLENTTLLRIKKEMYLCIAFCMYSLISIYLSFCLQTHGLSSENVG
jgi:hypothetical protein